MKALQGSIVALITPFKTDGAVDFAAYKKLIAWHVQEGSDGLVVLGTTGEAATISLSERDQLLRIAVELVEGRFPVIAGTGSNCTAETIRLTQHARECGVDAALVVTPYYNRPTEEGLFQHYTAVSQTVDLPVILYNVPSRTGIDLDLSTVRRLSVYDNIVAIKQAVHDLSRVAPLVDTGLSVLSGDDSCAFDFIQQGAVGVVSVTANVAPGRMHSWVASLMQGDTAAARSINTQLEALYSGLFLETNPIPTKWALSAMGKISPTLRLPLTTLSVHAQDKLLEALSLAKIPLLNLLK